MTQHFEGKKHQKMSRNGEFASFGIGIGMTSQIFEIETEFTQKKHIS